MGNNKLDELRREQAETRRVLEEALEAEKRLMAEMAPPVAQPHEASEQEGPSSSAPEPKKSLEELRREQAETRRILDEALEEERRLTQPSDPLPTPSEGHPPVEPTPVPSSKKSSSKEKTPSTQTPSEEIKSVVADLGLEAILPSGFAHLSEAQQLKVVKDLKKRIVDVVKSNAQTKYSEELKKRVAGDTSKFAKTVGALIDPLKKETEIRNLEKQIFGEIKATPEGRTFIADDLALLTERTRGKNIFIGLSGKIHENYLNAAPANEGEARIFGNFNEKAEKFAGMPYEWGQEKGGKHKKEYDQVKAEYEKAKEEILAIKKREEGPDEKGKAILEVMEMDNAIQMEQLLNTHPEFEKALAGFEKSAGAAEVGRTGISLLQNIIGKNAVNKMLFAGGFGLRWAARGAAAASGTTLLTLAAAPIIGAGIGGLRARFRAKDTLEERQKLARHGQEDESKERVVTTDATHLTRRLEEMLLEIQNVSDDETAKKLLAQLVVRIDHTQGKIEKGQVNFGDAKSALVNQYNLISVLNQALMVKERFSEHADAELKKRIDGLLVKAGTGIAEKTSAAQNEFIKTQMKRGALIGAGAATAGYMVRWAGEYLGWWGEAQGTGAPKQPGTEEGFMDRVEKMLKSWKFWGDENEPRPGTGAPGKDIHLPSEPSKPGAGTSDVPPSTETAPEKLDGSITFDKGKGGIQGLLDLKEEMREKYKGDMSKLPQHIQDFLNDKSRVGNLEMAKQLGFFDPANPEESALIREGSSLRFDEKSGKIIFHDARTGEDVEKYGGKMFDSDKSGVRGERTRPTNVPEGPEPVPPSPVLEPLPKEVPTETTPTTAEELKKRIEGEIDLSKEPVGTVIHQGGNRIEVTGRGEGGTNITWGPSNPPPIIGRGGGQGGFNTLWHSSGYPGGYSNSQAEILANQGYNMGVMERGEYFPELSRGDNLILQTHPEFAKNPFHLDGPSLLEVYKTSESNLNHILHPDMLEKWNSLKLLSAKNILTDKNFAEDRDWRFMVNHLKRLEEVSGLKPKGGGLFRKPETLEKYIIRASQKVMASRGSLEAITLLKR